jgi:hypothetical protein
MRVTGVLRSFSAFGFLLLFGAMDSSYVSPPAAPAPPVDNPIQLQLDTSEAEAVLVVLDKLRARHLVEEGTWAQVFASEPYRRLKQRETGMQRAFTDSAFRRFVESPALVARADSLRRTLAAWSQADLAASARRVLAYLPDTARIRARVYPVIKPQSNSFVFEPATNAAIFLYLDPTVSAAQFENTVAHELHHIGFASVSGSQEAMRATLSPGGARVVEWMGAFGEGLAMLAAAGGPDVHPHAVSPAADRARWDRDMAHFNDDLRSLEKFFTGILDGSYKSEAEVQKAGYSFFGVQGPWYTVGYRMAVMVERRFGRDVLIECMLDPRELCARYNAAAADSMRAGHAPLATWSPEFLRRLGTRGY